VGTLPLTRRLFVSHSISISRGSQRRNRSYKFQSASHPVQSSSQSSIDMTANTVHCSRPTWHRAGHVASEDLQTTVYAIAVLISRASMQRSIARSEYLQTMWCKRGVHPTSVRNYSAH
jgi:hypothetical protein